MKKHLLLLLLVFTIVGAHLHSQEYTPMLVDSSYWYQISPGEGLETDVYKLINEDTLLNDKTYKILFRSSCLFGSINRSVIFLREDTAAKKVFSVEPYTDIVEEKLLYDFSLLPGDTFVYDGYEPLILEEISDTLFIDQACKTYYFNNGAIWVEGIGSLGELLFPTIIPAWYFFYISCYYRSGILTYQSEEAIRFGTCCIFTGIENLKSSPGIKKIYPLPFEDKLTIELQDNISGNMELSLFDITGKKVLEYKGKILPGNKNIALQDLSHLRTGIYLIKGRMGKEYFTMKVSKR